MFPEMTKIFQTPVTYGIAAVDHVEVTRLQSMMSSFHPGEYCDEGTYCRLLVNGRIMMSDTRMEHLTNYEVVRQAHGNVLIAGLGLGMILHPILAKKEVLSVTVIEKYADVIALVEPTVQNKKLTIIEGDIYEWKPAKGTKYETLYFDIWSEQSTDCLEEMRTLHLRFKPFKVKEGWMNSWRREELKNQKRRDDRSGW
jgi:hypothetical protein